MLPRSAIQFFDEYNHLMSISEMFTLFLQQVRETALIQWIAVAFGVAQVLLARANKIWLYPAGLISSALTFYILSDVKLYAEAFLNLYYVIMSIYGWYHWSSASTKPAVRIGYTNFQEWIGATLIALVGCVLLFVVLDRYTDSDVPLWDAFVSATAWAGTWLLTRRKLENWILLNISNHSAIRIN